MLIDSIKLEIGIALRKKFEELTEREIDLLWRYTENDTMDVLLKKYPV